MKKVVLALLVVLTTASLSFAGLTYTELPAGDADGYLIPLGLGGDTDPDAGYMHYKAEFDDGTGVIWTADIQEIVNSFDGSSWSKDPDVMSFHVTLISADPNGLTTLNNVVTSGPCYQVMNFTENLLGVKTYYGTPIDMPLPGSSVTSLGPFLDTRFLRTNLATLGTDLVELGSHMDINDESLGIGIGWGNLEGDETPRWKDLDVPPDGEADGPEKAEWITWTREQIEDHEAFDAWSTATTYAISGAPSGLDSLKFLQIAVPRNGLVVPTSGSTAVAMVTGAATNAYNSYNKIPATGFEFAIGAIEGAEVPEPSTIIMLVLGALCLVGIRRRK